MFLNTHTDSSNHILSAVATVACGGGLVFDAVATEAEDLGLGAFHQTDGVAGLLAGSGILSATKMV